MRFVFVTLLTALVRELGGAVRLVAFETVLGARARFVPVLICGRGVACHTAGGFDRRFGVRVVTVAAGDIGMHSDGVELGPRLVVAADALPDSIFVLRSELVASQTVRDTRKHIERSCG
jgi:hypothetical protein